MERSLIVELSEAMAAFCRAQMNRKANLPIRSSEMGVLIFITIRAGDVGVKAVDISNHFGIRKPSVSNIIQSLEKQGYVEREVSEQDKRISPLFPTPKGKALVDQAFEEHHLISQQLIARIGVRKSEEFLTVLKEITEIIQQGDESK